MNYTKINNYLGWAVFIFASFVYLTTMEETTSLWDCGEYITTANKLEVGHPPGAPFFMMMGRIFSSFASPENAAMMVNSMSAISSSLTILFMFWTLTMLARKLSVSLYGKVDKSNTVAIFGSALVGALAYTFTDSFWFSAVEGEVYAMSSFFTALVVWAAFKWERETDYFNKDIAETGASTYRPNRWLIFIAYMIGLSIGVHLLNLLAIPAIGYIIYFKKSKVVDLKGFIITGLISFATLGFVQAFLIPQIPSFADVFERTFTNSFGLPFNSGFIFFVLLMGGLLTYGMIYTAKTKKLILNNVIVGFTMLVLGYSTFAMIVVRSNANTPLDENNPETLSSLVSYLNRDQYGSWPILKGQYWNSPTMPGSGEDTRNAPKVSFMKVFSAKLSPSTISTDIQTINAIKEIVKPLELRMDFKSNGGTYKLSTQIYKDYVLYDGIYQKPTSASISELGEVAKFSLSFMNMFDYNEYQEKIKVVNAELAQSGIDFKINLSTDVVSEYINVKAGQVGDRKYDPEYTTMFPRMYRQGNGSKYMAWIDYQNNEHSIALPPSRQYEGAPRLSDRAAEVSFLKGIGSEEATAYANQLLADGIYKPNFMGENISYMFDYQFGWMYGRYLMWNFSGRQNETQGYGMNGGGRRFLDGNWLSGVDFIDSERLGNQANLPAFIIENKGYNRYFMLPLILALIGFIFHLVRAPKDWFVLMLLFLLTGLAIAFYLNQKPMEPRERDYAFAASFYAFAFWIGIGVFALFDAARKFEIKNIGIIAGSAFGAGIVVFLSETIQGEGASHAFSYSIFYMSVVGVGAYALVGFVGDKLKNGHITGGLATALGLAVPLILGIQNWDDHDRSNRTTARDFAFNYLRSCDEKAEGGKGAIIFTNGDNDTFPLWYIQEVEGVRTDVRVANMSLLGTDWHINQMRRKAYDSEPLEITMNEFSFRNGTRDLIFFNDQINRNSKTNGKYVSIDDAMDMLLDNNNRYLEPRTGNMESFYDFKGVYMVVDKQAALKNGIISQDQMALAQDTIKWSIPPGYLVKSDMAVLDLFRNYKWDRPIYFASLGGLQANKALNKYLQGEGLAFKLTPIPNVGVNIDKMYDLVMDKENGFLWGNMKGEGVYVDYYTMRMVYNLRIQFKSFTDELLAQGEKEKTIEVLDRIFEEMPIENSQVAVDDICYYLCANYYEAGAKEKGDALAKKLAKVKLDEIKYYLGQDEKFFLSMFSEYGKSMNLLEMIRSASDPEVYALLQKFQSDQYGAQAEYNSLIDELKSQVEMGMYTSEEQIKAKQQEIEAKVSANIAKVESEYYTNAGDATKSFYKASGPFAETEYEAIMLKAKENFNMYRANPDFKDLFKTQRVFPQVYEGLWSAL